MHNNKNVNTKSLVNIVLQYFIQFSKGLFPYLFTSNNLLINNRNNINDNKNKMFYKIPNINNNKNILCLYYDNKIKSYSINRYNHCIYYHYNDNYNNTKYNLKRSDYKQQKTKKIFLNNKQYYKNQFSVLDNKYKSKKTSIIQDVNF